MWKTAVETARITVVQDQGNRKEQASITIRVTHKETGDSWQGIQFSPELCGTRVGGEQSKLRLPRQKTEVAGVDRASSPNT